MGPKVLGPDIKFNNKTPPTPTPPLGHSFLLILVFTLSFKPSTEVPPGSNHCLVRTEAALLGPLKGLQSHLSH